MNTNEITTGGIHLKSVDFRNDPMFLRNQFARDGTFELPVIKKTKLDLDNIEFVGYDRLSEKERDDEKGRAKTDIDYTNHGNPTKHPNVPHEHHWDWSNPDSPIRR